MLNAKRLMNGVFFAAWTLASLTAGAATWTGKGGDHLWSNPDNWDTPPSNFGSITIQKGEGDGDASVVVTTNDLSGLRYWGFTTKGDTPVVVRGNQIKIHSMSLNVDTTMDADFWFDYAVAEGNAFFLSLDSPTPHQYVFNGKVQYTNTGTNFFIRASQAAGSNNPNDGSATQARAQIYFKGGLDTGTMSFCPMCSADIYFDAPLTAASIVRANADAFVWMRKSLHFRCAGNSFRGFGNFRTAGIYAEVAQAFDETNVIGFSVDDASNWPDDGQSYYLCGHDMTVDRLVSGGNYIYNDPSRPENAAFNVYPGATSTDAAAATLTLKNTADATCYIRLMGDLGLVIDSAGGFTQTFVDRVHGTTGPIVVKRGRLSLKGATTFANVTSVKVGNGGVLDVSESTSAVFGGATTLEVVSGAKLVIPEGKTLAVAALVVDGEPVKADDYANKPFIEGDGTLSVTGIDGVSSWISPTDGLWSDAANWDTVVPTSGARLLRSGTYAVSTEGATLPTALQLEMANPSDGRTELDVYGEQAFVKASFKVGRNSTLAIKDGADVSFDNWTLDMDASGTLAVTNGRASFLSYPVESKGTIDVGGSGELVYVKNGFMSFMKVPTMTFSGDAVLTNASPAGKQVRWYVQTIPTGPDVNLVFAGRSRLFEGAATIDSFVVGNTTSANADYPGRATMTVKDGAVVQFGNGLNVGTGAQADGELTIAGHASAFVNYYGTEIGAATGDAAKPSKGVLRMSGGAFYNHARVPQSGHVYGLIVGEGQTVEATDGQSGFGAFYLDGGAITNANAAYLLVGSGSADGIYEQTGGLFYNKCQYTSVVGFRGGTGTMKVTGGTLDLRAGDLYVGGCPTNVLGVCFTKLPTDKSGFGTLEIGGGEIRAKNVYLGLEGCGELTVSGGTLAVASNLTLCDYTDKVLADTSYCPKLTFRVGADGGHGFVDVKGTLTIPADTKLVIDLGDYEGKAVKLIAAKGVDGAFADVTVTGAKADEAKWTFRNGVLKCGVPQGSVLVVR